MSMDEKILVDNNFDQFLIFKYLIGYLYKKPTNYIWYPIKTVLPKT